MPDLVGNPDDRFSRDAAHLASQFVLAEKHRISLLKYVNHIIPLAIGMNYNHVGKYCCTELLP